jgi:cell division protein FtsN
MFQRPCSWRKLQRFVCGTRWRVTELSDYKGWGLEMDTAVWIVIAVVVVLLIVAVALAIARKRQAHKRVEAAHIRENAAERTPEVEERQALADESAARARRAQADAEAKAAEARRLSLQADTHMGDAASSRDELDAEYERANKLDPDVKKRSGAGDVDKAAAEKMVASDDAHDNRRGTDSHGLPGDHRAP